MTDRLARCTGLGGCLLSAGLALALPAGCGVPAASGGGAAGYTAVSSAALEQLALERINRARLKPTAEAAMAGIDLNEGVPANELISTDAKQPLAMNTSLARAAREHSQDMLTRNYFEHNTPEGVTPFERMFNAGYAFTAAGEDLVWRGDAVPINEVSTLEQEHTDLFVDAGVVGRGHRTTMLNPLLREVGIGLARGNYTDSGNRYDTLMQTQDYGAPTSGSTFVLGVVYTDNNHNRQYDYGEGVSGSAVTLDAETKITNSAGGYSFEVRQPGVYVLGFVSGPSRTLTIENGSPNIKIDLLDGSTVVINLGVGFLK